MIMKPVEFPEQTLVEGQIIGLRYDEKCALTSDIGEHLPVLRRYAAGCGHVTELGVRTVVSTWAFLAGLQASKGQGPKVLVSVDVAAPPGLVMERLSFWGRMASWWEASLFRHW